MAFFVFILFTMFLILFVYGVLYVIDMVRGVDDDA